MHPASASGLMRSDELIPTGDAAGRVSIRGARPYLRVSVRWMDGLLLIILRSRHQLVELPIMGPPSYSVSTVWVQASNREGLNLVLCGKPRERSTLALLGCGT